MVCYRRVSYIPYDDSFSKKSVASMAIIKVGLGIINITLLS